MLELQPLTKQMSAASGFRFLRPYLCKSLPIKTKTAYIRFFNTTRCLEKKRGPHIKNLAAVAQSLDESIEFRGAVGERKRELEAANALVYPRIRGDDATLSCSDFLERYSSLHPGELKAEETVLVRGRISSFRIASKKLLFLDIVQDGHKVQGVCDLSRLNAFSGVFAQKFRDFYHLIRRGDIIAIYGRPYCTRSGQLSVNAVELPAILSPSLASLPNTLDDRQTRIRNRHVDLLVNKKVADTVRVRSHIIQHIRDFLLKDDFLEVQTPIIAGEAGGAIARPFTTVATEFSEKQLALRIAPEIWLKRLILGGMDKVFEIGPAFRNEGLDATHNPEFTTCEFYKSFADLEELISMTEKLIFGLAHRVETLRKFPLKELPELHASLFTTPFKRIHFIPAIEEALGQSLPDLARHDATEQLISLFSKHEISVPLSPTLPRLLDKLASTFVEPQCNEPTFIMHHPACMGPLAKSFLDPTTNQIVSARAELFIQTREIANMYEEENSPFEQRAKFVQQAQWRDDDNSAVVDENYLEALEWGLPPTGGWGCGLDRLVMLFSGATRISDVLSFGSLKTVVNLSNAAGRKKASYGAG